MRAQDLKALHLLTGIAVALCSCVYQPECRDRPSRHFTNPVDILEAGDSVVVSNTSNQNTSCYHYLNRFEREEIRQTVNGDELPRRFIEVEPFPGMLAADLSGRYLYTVTRETNRLQIVDLATDSPAGFVDIGPDPYLVLRLDGVTGSNSQTLATSSLDEASLRLFDLSDPANPTPLDSDGDETNGVTHLNVGGGSGNVPDRAALDPAGGRGWVSFQSSNNATLGVEFTWADGLFATRNLTITGSDAQASATRALAYDPTHNWIWIAARVTRSDLFVTNALYAFDAATLAQVRMTVLGEEAFVHSLTAADGRLYAAMYSENQLWAFDGESGEVIAKVGVGEGPALVKLNDEGDRLYILNYLSNSIMTLDPDPRSATYLEILQVIR